MYLKHGYMINRPKRPRILNFPFSASDAHGIALDAGRTYGLNELISNLHLVIQMTDKEKSLRGVKIAKVISQQGRTWCNRGAMSLMHRTTPT